MSEIRSTYLLQRWGDGTLSFVFCVRDGYPNGRRHFSGSVFGGNLLPQKYSPTRRDDFVRGDSSGARPERTLGGEGRGWYAGASAYGLHSQYAQNGGWSYGGQEQVYLGYGNNTGKQGADGKTGSVVSAELWLPTLGKYGHFAFGETYDVSNQGIQNVQRKLLVSMGLSDADIDALSNVGESADRAFEKIKNKLAENGYELVPRPEGTTHGKNVNKYTYKLKTASVFNYGNIEFIQNKSATEKDSYIYSSYNYGNNIFTHFIIDFIGWEARENN